MIGWFPISLEIENYTSYHKLAIKCTHLNSHLIILSGFYLEKKLNGLVYLRYGDKEINRGTCRGDIRRVL